MIKGKRYEIIVVSGTKPKRFVLDYIGETSDTFLFSARPDFGTQVIRCADLRSAKLVSRSTPIKIK